jgi:hypothetical protein
MLMLVALWKSLEKSVDDELESRVGGSAHQSLTRESRRGSVTFAAAVFARLAPSVLPSKFWSSMAVASSPIYPHTANDTPVDFLVPSPSAARLQRLPDRRILSFRHAHFYQTQPRCHTNTPLDLEVSETTPPSHFKPYHLPRERLARSSHPNYQMALR